LSTTVIKEGKYIMAKPNPRLLEVIRTTYITPNMCRVTLGGDDLLDFPIDQESAYIKLIFPQGEDARPLMRTYTVSIQRNDEIDVDFALHEAEGPASTWARNAQVGDQILVGGPGPKKLINNDAD
jgi:NADPH-dependent ferric siderophore reductase